MTRPRLKKGDITIKEVLETSQIWYKMKKKVKTRTGSEKTIGDDKPWRAKMDVVNGKISMRRGMTYDRKTKSWSQTTREVRIDLIVKTNPKSYIDKSGIKNHYYPVIFLIRDWEKGLDSAFRWRTGSMKKPKLPEKKLSELKSKSAKEAQRKKNIKNMKYNIKSGIQLQWFFDSCRVNKKFGLLFGPDYTNGEAEITNPDDIPFFDKHAYWIIKNVLPNLFNNPKLNQGWDNSLR